jgi:hypothetical protein
MPARAAKRPCNSPCCRELVSRPDLYCPRHAVKAKQRQYEEKKADPTWQLYQTPRWKNFRRWFLRLNVLCMRVIDGKQCMNWATTVHHRRGLRSHPEDLICAEQCAAVCSEHHHNDDGDRPGDVYVEVDTRLSLEKTK